MGRPKHQYYVERKAIYKVKVVDTWQALDNPREHLVRMEMLKVVAEDPRLVPPTVGQEFIKRTYNSNNYEGRDWRVVRI